MTKPRYSLLFFFFLVLYCHNIFQKYYFNILQPIQPRNDVYVCYIGWNSIYTYVYKYTGMRGGKRNAIQNQYLENSITCRRPFEENINLFEFRYFRINVIR